ncbi:hypothetical protein [Ursidibacter sp. B-7004-1]
MNNNQTWTLAKQFPNVAEQGLQALRDWSAKADMQRERMAILQYYAEERENRDAREARNANLARNVVGGMGVSLGSANSFNSFGSFGSGLYFDNNINTLMVRLSFLDREMRLDEITSEFIDKRLYSNGKLIDMSLSDSKTVMTAIAAKTPERLFDAEGNMTVLGEDIVTGDLNNIGVNVGKGENGKLKVDLSNATQGQISQVVNQYENKTTSPPLTPQQQGHVSQANNITLNAIGNAATNYPPIEQYKNMLKASGRAFGEKEQEAWNKASQVYGGDENKVLKVVIEEDKKLKEYISKLGETKIANMESTIAAGGEIKVSLNDTENYYLREAAKQKHWGKDQLPVNTLKQLSFCKTPQELASVLKNAGVEGNDFNTVLGHMKKVNGDDALKNFPVLTDKDYLDASSKFEKGKMDFTEKEYEAFVKGRSSLGLKHDFKNIKVDGKPLDEYKKEKEEAKEKSNEVKQDSKASKAEPFQELAPENKGKPDSQVSLVSAIATPKPTRTYKQEQTEQEKDEERRKREEKDVLDRVEPNRTADHSPRALNEKNTTASIEEQKIILAQQERNMTQEEKMRIEQEKQNQRQDRGLDA